MPRRYRPERRDVVPDPKYNNKTIARFINRMMRGGKKGVAQRIMYEAFDIIEQRTKRDPVEVFEQAMANAMPQIEVKPRRVGGATYQVPVEVRPERREALAQRWLIQFARKRHGKSMAEKLAAELMDAANNQGATIRKRDETHKMAEANRAFAHYRW
ncbi:MAG TPA: 30S ribosomal protein S7 [Anaerolineae bacterium]|nr:30S ribosomal protein S7 [Caldilineae bacterium]HID35146.1 30S ribosomal protein S7 [Anaerolineae bacterium]HIQ11605.1 30S ribosomal protein S7 [Caldilineales bacterium]